MNVIFVARNAFAAYLISSAVSSVVKTIRPDTVFVPYHWPLDRAANNCTIRAIDPVSNIPEYKICAVRVSKAEPPHDPIARLDPAAGGVR